MDKNDSSTALDLTRLSEAERDALRLLGQGHTAKSIAALRGISVAAVNERLRSGRRKTDVSSSRELARQLIAQENRDDLIELASQAEPAPPSSLQEAPRRSASVRRLWRVPMFATAILAAVALAQQTSVSPSASYSAPDNAHAAIQRLANQPSWDPQALHERVTTGERDESWSPAAEARLSALYGAISGIAPSDLSIRCSADLCEVAGTTARELSRNRAFAAIQDVQAITQADGLAQTGYSVGAGPAETLAFLTYWRRDD